MDGNCRSAEIEVVLLLSVSVCGVKCWHFRSPNAVLRNSEVLRGLYARWGGNGEVGERWIEVGEDKIEDLVGVGDSCAGSSWEEEENESSRIEGPDWKRWG